MEQSSRSKGVNLIIVFIVLVILVGSGFLGWKFYERKNSSSQSKVWQEGGVAIDGPYADADVVKLNEEEYRMYYAVEPEVPDNELEVYSAISTDGINWQKEDGVRKNFAVTPSVIKISDDKWRMYFQNEQEIKSAISSDGLGWQDESGVRIDKAETGFSLDVVVSPTVTKLDDGTYLMVYRGVEEKKAYQTTEKIPNNSTSYLFSATSNDGLTWQKKGLVLDSQNDIYYGLVDGPELVTWDKNELRLYFWTYTGVYYLVYQNGEFLKDPVLAFRVNGEGGKFTENPPCDPSLIRIKDTWFMYYGQHTKGIYYAILNP